MFGAMSFRGFSVQRSKRGPYFRLDFLKRSAALTKSFSLWLPREVFAFVAYQRCTKVQEVMFVTPPSVLPSKTLLQRTLQGI
jgi:hypothetical protein